MLQWSDGSALDDESGSKDIRKAGSHSLLLLSHNSSTQFPEPVPAFLIEAEYSAQYRWQCLVPVVRGSGVFTCLVFCMILVIASQT